MSEDFAQQKSQTQIDTARAQSLVFKSRVNIRDPETGRSTLTTIAPENYIDEIQEYPEDSGSSEVYAFQVVQEGGLKVREGTVNTQTVEEFEPSGQPTELWLKATFNASDEVTAAYIVTSAGSTSATEDYRQVASITWDGNTPTIIQGIKGSQSIASCGATHQWGTLYS